MTAAGNMRKAYNLRIGNKEFKGLSKFRYLGNIIENNNRNDRCIKEYKQGTKHIMKTFRYSKVK
jgi:hypothetical protein